MESTENTDTKKLKIISIKGTAPAIHCVENGFSKAPQNLRKFVERLANGRDIESVQKKELVVGYTFILRDSEKSLLVEKSKKRETETPEQEIPRNSIKIALTEYGEELFKIGISCEGAEVEPRKNIERFVKTLNKTGMVFKRKSHLFEDGESAGVYLTIFDYLLDPVDGDESSRGIEQRLEKQQKKISFLEEQVGFSADLFLTLLSENPELLKKPEVVDYLKEEGIPTTLFLEASDYKKRNFFLRELYEVIEEDVDITRKQIESNKKSHEIAVSRHIIMYLLRRKLNKDSKLGSFQEIGRCMGGKNHVTVLLAYKHFQENEKDFPFELTGDIKTDYENAKSLYLHFNSKNTH